MPVGVFGFKQFLGSEYVDADSGQSYLRTSEYVSMDNGPAFVDRCASVLDPLMSNSYVAERVLPSQVNSLLAVFPKRNAADLYVNEVGLLAESVLRGPGVRPIGDEIRESDLIDVHSLKLICNGEHISIEPTQGFAVLVSIGWRKGLVYDVGPIGFEPRPREFDVEKTLAQVLLNLAQPQLFRITEAQWQYLIDSGWFPFIHLRAETRDRLIAEAQMRTDLDALVPSIVAEVKESAPELKRLWCESSLFESHLPFLNQALDGFIEENWVVCCSMLYPRLEGILRSISARGHSGSTKTNALISNSMPSQDIRPLSPLLPERFRQYLRRWVFKNFSGVDRDSSASRHSFAHGVAESNACTPKASVVAILSAQQLYHSFPRESH